MSDVKHKKREWVPSYTNQMRLRHLRQVCARGIVLESPSEMDKNVLYFTLHITTMSAPFYTSESLSGVNIDWADLDIRKFPESIVTSCPGLVVRLWSKEVEENATPKLVTVWGLYFSGLSYLGSQIPKEGDLFYNNTLIFGMSWGYFVDPKTLRTQLVSPALPPSANDGKTNSYSLSSMCRIHRMQRAIYKENAEAERLRQEIQLAQSNPTRYRNSRMSVRAVPAALASTPADLQALQELKARRQVALARVSMLQQERSRQSKSLEKLKETLKTLRVDNHTRALHLKEKQFHLQMDKDRLCSMVKNVAAIEEQCFRTRLQLVSRRRQLLAELAEIFPIIQIKEGMFSINDVVLPNADAFTGCDDLQLSVALGHVTHLVQMLSIFLQVPNRYPMTVCGSRSHITDQASQRDPEAPREFPLFVKGKDRLYFEYAVYLLNKNIAQLRWLCGQNTTDLAATLPNLVSLIQFLLTPSPNEEMRMTKRSESHVDKGGLVTPRSGSITSASSASRHLINKGQLHRVSRSLAGSQVSLTDPNSMASTVSLDHLTDSPQAGGYFRQPPTPQNSGQRYPWSGSQFSSTMSLDLAVDHMGRHPGGSPFFSPVAHQPLLNHHGGSAPDLLSPEICPIKLNFPMNGEASTENTSKQPQNGNIETDSSLAGSTPVTVSSSIVPATPDDFPKAATVPDPLFADDGMDSVSARTEALAVCSTFKLRSRSRTSSIQQSNA